METEGRQSRCRRESSLQAVPRQDKRREGRIAGNGERKTPEQGEECGGKKGRGAGQGPI